MPLFFTPTQATESLPEVEKALASMSEIKEAAEKINDETEVTDATERLQCEIQKLDDLGCLLKDMNMGLVDFPAVRLGVRVWLCWKSGEKKVEFWHGLQEGFAGRKPVNESDFYPDDLAIRALTGEVPKPTQ